MKRYALWAAAAGATAVLVAPSSAAAPRAGTYRFTTEDLGDYFELESVGHHYHLLLVAKVV